MTPAPSLFLQGLKTFRSKQKASKTGGARTVSSERRRAYERLGMYPVSSKTQKKKSTTSQRQPRSIYDVQPQRGELAPYGYVRTKSMSDAARQRALDHAVRGWPERQLPAIGARHVARHLRLISNKMRPSTHADAIDRLRTDADWVTRKYHDSAYWVINH